MTERGYAWTLVATGLVILACAVLAGCQTTQPQIQTVYVDRVVVQRPSIAPDVLQCLPEPVPLGPGARQRDLPPYVIAVVKAGRDCRRKLSTVALRVKGGRP